MDRTENDVSSNFYIVACVLVAAITFLPRRCLATLTYIYTDWREPFTKYAVQMGSGAMIHIPSFIQIGSGFPKLIGRDTQIHRQEDGIAYFRKVGYVSS
jgi:hypothetical protein